MVKIALIGCGTMGRVHSAAYEKIDCMQLVAFCDIQEEKAQTLAQGHSGAKIYTSFKEMMENESFDILDVCLPTYMHREYCEEAMNSGKNVFCEKPIALTNEDAQAMIDCAEKNNVKFSVGQVLRFFPMYKQAAQKVEDGRIGIPRLIRTVRNQAFPQWSWQGWYQDYGKSGGPIVDLALHDIDWIIANFGDVERVFAKTINGKVENQDHCLITLRLANGGMAHVEASWAYPQGSSFHTSFEIVGTKAQIEYDSINFASIHMQKIENNAHKSTYLSPIDTSLEPYRAELLAFINCVVENTKPVITADQAAKTLRVALAAVESATCGKPITLQRGV